MTHGHKNLNNLVSVENGGKIVKCTQNVFHLDF